MGSELETARTVADRLQAARRSRFVGRLSELELFRDALAADEPPFAVLFICGPGGVGKTALLAALAEEARLADRRVVSLDLQGIEPSPPGFVAALAAALGLDGDADPLATLASVQGSVVLLDTLEAAPGLESWLRERFLPALPAGALVAVASRNRPEPAWRKDPAWSELLRVISLRNLAPEDARAFLQAAGVNEELHERLLALTHGYPLALSLVVDVLEQRGSGGSAPLDLRDVPDVVESLLGVFLATVPTPAHRRTLECAAHARFTTEALLRAVFDGAETGELFAWLRALSFVESGPHGLFLHDLARDVIDADLRWRDPVEYEAVHRRIRSHVVDRLKTTAGREREQAIADLIYLHRGNPATRGLWDWASLGQVYADRLRPDDREAVVAMVEQHEGPESAAIAAHWIECQPEGFVVARSADAAPVGVLAHIALHLASPEERARDPGAEATWAHAERFGPPRPGEEVLVARFFVDRDAYQAPSPTFNVVTMSSVREWIGRPRLAWYYIPYADAGAGAPMMSYIDFRREPAADFEVGGRRYAVFARDWRHGGVEGWLDLMGARELGSDGAEQPPERAAPALALSKPEFTDAVRRALRDLHRPAALATNPLLRTRLLPPEDSGPETLAQLLRDAIASVADDPRDERLARALDRTYVHPAPTQERAAELLGLPFSTYRGHLARGIERVVELLWQRELYGER